MNDEQIKSVIRGLIQTFGGMIAGWFAAKGWFTVDQVMTVLNSPSVIGFIASIVGLAWGVIVHTQKNAVAVVAAISPETKVVTTPAIADAVGRADVLSATQVKVVSK